MKFAISACMMLLACNVASAATATVGATGPTPRFSTLSEAVTYITVNSSPPNVISVMDDHTDNAQIVVSVPLQITGDPDGTGQMRTITVNPEVLEVQTDAGASGRSYIEIQAEGSVELSALRIQSVGDATEDVECIKMLKPNAGLGAYTLNQLQVGGTVGGNYVPATDADPFGTADSRWKGAAINVANSGGSGGAYEAYILDTHASAADGDTLYISNSTGKTVVNGGVFAAPLSFYCIFAFGSENTEISGTASNRVRLNGGEGLHLFSATNATVQFVDLVKCSLVSNASTVDILEHVRVYNPSKTPVSISGSTVTAKNTTIHGSTAAVINSLAEFTSCIFTSNTNGYIATSGGNPVFDYCAFPTDGYLNESLNTTNPFTSPVTESHSINSSPHYQTVTYTLSDVTNHNFLRPTNPSYATASSSGGWLYGGAGPGDSSVIPDWNIY